MLHNYFCLNSLLQMHLLLSRVVTNVITFSSFLAAVKINRSLTNCVKIDVLDESSLHSLVT